MKENIKEVLLLFKTHLDIGFTNYSKNVEKQYVEQFIPNAIKVGYQLKDTKTPFIWTVGSWLIHTALKTDDGTLEQAIKDGIISWHGVPFTTHTELMSPALFKYALSLSKDLDKRFNKKNTSAKFTDVPGHTIGIVPYLYDAGIKFLHIGVNPATPLPDVPPLFIWKCQDKSIVVMYEDSYGDIKEMGDFAVVFAHTGDNNGPQNPEEIIKVYEDLRGKYPNATIKAVTLNELGERICGIENLPVIEKEIGDSWIHGAGTDPKKVSKFRTLMRYIDKNGVDDKDLTDNLLLVPEHTWGMDIKTHFPHTTHFLNDKFEGMTTAKEKVEKSWEEQRQYVYDAEKVLGITADYDTDIPDLTGFTEAEEEPLNVTLSWQIFDNSDYERYNEKYVKIPDDWAIWDFTKVGLPHYVGGIYDAKVKKVYKNETSKVEVLDFDEDIKNKYGLPQIYVICQGENITVKWHGKKKIAVPQACWLKFNGYDEKWELNKMGQYISPEDIIGSPLITAVYDGVRNKDTYIKTLDAPLVAPFGRHLLDYRLKETKQDLYFCLYNNIWNTNFPMWYGDDAVFRFIKTPYVEKMQ